jgi:hypothetical protein
VGVAYRGSYSIYGREGLNSIGQDLALSASRRLSARMMLSFNTNAGIYTRDFGLLGPSPGVTYDPATAYIPTTDFFDNRTYYSASQLGLTIQKSARLSFGMSGALFLARRSSTALYGTTGAAATGDVQYRLTRHTTIGVFYSYTHGTAFHVVGTSDAHTIGGSYSRQLGPRTEFSGFAGAVRPELKFLQTSPLDPAVARLLGITEPTLQISHTIRVIPTWAARLSRGLHRGAAYVMAGQTVSPGNGLFLTSAMTNYTAGYGYTGIRRWSLNSSASYALASSIQNVRGAYSSLSAGAAVSRTLSRGFHWYADYSARQYSSPTFTGYNRIMNQVTVGFGYSPGDVPLRVW